MSFRFRNIVQAVLMRRMGIGVDNAYRFGEVFAALEVKLGRCPSRKEIEKFFV